MNQTTTTKPQGAEKKIIAGVLGILLGSIGVHKFFLGYIKEGIIMLLITFIGSFIVVGPVIMTIIGLIEGIIYLCKSDKDFVETYIAGRRPWF